MNGMWTKVLRPGEKWSGCIGKGKCIRFSTAEAGANVSMLMYNMRDTSERYNMPDTLKAQYTAYLKQGNVLMSDNGRVLASIVEDNVGWHDTISGYCTRKAVNEKYGETSYQEIRNDYYRSGEENFAVELVRNNMSVRDLVPCVNLFSKVYCKEDGSLNYDENNCHKDSTVVLRTEMDIILILSNTPNPLDERKEYPSVPVKITVSDAQPVTIDDECVNSREENFRAFENTWDYYNLLGL